MKPNLFLLLLCFCCHIKESIVSSLIFENDSSGHCAGNSWKEGLQITKPEKVWKWQWGVLCAKLADSTEHPMQNLQNLGLLIENEAVNPAKWHGHQHWHAVLIFLHLFYAKTISCSSSGLNLVGQLRYLERQAQDQVRRWSGWPRVSGEVILTQYGAWEEAFPVSGPQLSHLYYMKGLD